MKADSLMGFWKANRDRWKKVAELNTNLAIFLAAEEVWDFREKELELNKKLLARQCDLARVAETELEALKNKYYDLIMSVETKYDGETRHETAKRYIVHHTRDDRAAVEDKPKEGE